MHTRRVCNNCTRKQAWRKQNGGWKHFKDVLTDETISENSGEADLIVHLQNRRQQIMNQLRATLAVFKYVKMNFSCNYMKILAAHTHIRPMEHNFNQ